MINSILAVLTVAAAMGQEAPILIKPFDTAEECAIEASKRNNVEAAELSALGAGYVCLIIKPVVI